MYRTTDSRVMHNRLDWDVRGYSHGFYNRGQDSAGAPDVRAVEPQHRGLQLGTHGGDGLFLWAGQSTMDTGQGGANDNVFYGNDFSHAVANGIEATFSRNTFVSNRIDDCWHGIWGGYSYDTSYLQQHVRRQHRGASRSSTARTSRSSATRSTDDETAIRLWANATQDPNWGYPKARDTRSRDYTISATRSADNKTALNVMRTAGVARADNGIASVGDAA